MRAYLINPAKRTIEQIELAGWREFNVWIGCDTMAMATHWQSGDVLYVDDEGFHKPEPHFFRIPERRDQPLVGRGLLVGREIAGEQYNLPPAMTLAALQARVTWLDRDEARAMVTGKAAAFITPGLPGRPTGPTKVLSWWDDLI